MRKMRKKGVIEVQFNWIFIGIAGAVILIFFVNLAGSFRQGADLEMGQTIVSKMSEIATSAQSSDNSNTLLDISGLDINMECDTDSCSEQFGCTFLFDYAGRGVSTHNTAWMDIEPIFGPKDIKSDGIIFWSLSWVSPYKITNFLYLTYPEYKYLIVYDPTDPGSEAFADAIYTSITEANDKIYVEMLKKNEFEMYNYNGEAEFKAVFVVPLSGSPPLSISLPESIKESSADLHAVFIDSSSSNTMTKGAVKFGEIVNSELQPKTDGIAYLGTEMLFAAIFAEDHDFYNCNMKKALYKLQRLNTFYYNKAGLLQRDAAASCSAYYANMKDNIRSLNVTVNEMLDDPNTYSDFYVDLNSIQEQNSILQARGCAHLY